MMTKERMGEIALLLVKKQLREKSLDSIKNLKRDAGNESKRLGIAPDEAIEFASVLCREVLSETLADLS